MKHIAIFAEESSLFAAPYLAEAISCNLYVMLPQYNNFFGGGKMGIPWREGKNIWEEHLIVIGYAALKAIEKQLDRFETVAFINSESAACREWRWVEDVIRYRNITHYAMPDKEPYIRNGFIPAYQHIKIKRKPDILPGKPLVITHSPNNPEKYKLKGSKFIIDVVKELQKKHKFIFNLIQNMPMKKCIPLKGASHIFIDQVIYKNPTVPQARWGNRITYNGGLGKSGIEAMLMGVCTITGGIEPNTSEWFPVPPVVWTSYDDFSMDLERLIEDPDFRKQKAIDQKQWADKYTSAEFVANHVTQHIK